MTPSRKQADAQKAFTATQKARTRKAFAIAPDVQALARVQRRKRPEIAAEVHLALSTLETADTIAALAAARDAALRRGESELAARMGALYDRLVVEAAGSFDEE